MARQRLVDEVWPVSTPSTSSTVPCTGYRVRRSSRTVPGGEGWSEGSGPAAGREAVGGGPRVVVRGLGITSGLLSPSSPLLALRLAAASTVRAEDSDDESDALVVVIL